MRQHEKKSGRARLNEYILNQNVLTQLSCVDKSGYVEVTSKTSNPTLPRHKFAFDEVQVIGRVKRKTGRLFIEGIHSDANSTNRYLTLDQCYTPIKDRLNLCTSLMYYISHYKITHIQWWSGYYLLYLLASAFTQGGLSRHHQSRWPRLGRRHSRLGGPVRAH